MREAHAKVHMESTKAKDKATWDPRCSLTVPVNQCLSLSPCLSPCVSVLLSVSVSLSLPLLWLSPFIPLMDMD